MGLTSWLIIFYLTWVKAKECPDQERKKLIEGLLVKENPTHLLRDLKFSDVWVRNYLSVCECSYVEYIKKGETTMEDDTICRTDTGELIDQGKETMKETGKTGVYSLSGVFDTTGTDYTGFLYVIYADKYAVAYYACDCEGKTWNMGVQVKSDVRFKLKETGHNDVKKSVEEARLQMVKAAKIFSFDMDKEFITYKLDKLC